MGEDNFIEAMTRLAIDRVGPSNLGEGVEDNYYSEEEELPVPVKKTNKFKRFIIRCCGFKKEPVFKSNPRPVAEGAYADNFNYGHCMYCNNYNFYLKYDSERVICNSCLENPNVDLYLCRRCGNITSDIIKWCSG